MLELWTYVDSPVIGLFARAIVGSVLLYAGATKLGSYGQMIRIIQAYRLLPDKMVSAVGRVLPVLEVVIGGALLVGVLLPWAAFIAVSLYLVFTLAITINLLRGRRVIACGCFGVSGLSHLSWWLVGRNGILVAMSMFVAANLKPRLGMTLPSRAVEGIGMGLMFGLATVLWWLARKLIILWRLPTLVDEGAE